MDGTTGQTLGETSSFEGVRLYEVADVLDRRQLAVLLWARHRLVVYIGSTQTADGTIRANFEVSTSPNQNIANGVDAGAGAIEDQGGTEISLEVNPQEDSDTDDVIGPSLLAVGFGPITDGTNGVGGAGTAGFDDWEGPVMVEPVFDSRDELFVNGQVEASNVSDAAIHADLETWHTYGIIDD